MPNKDDALVDRNKKVTVRVRQKNRQEQKRLNSRLESIEDERQKVSDTIDNRIKNAQIKLNGVQINDFCTTPATRPISDDGLSAIIRPYSGYSTGSSEFNLDILSRPETRMSGHGGDEMEFESRTALSRPGTVYYRCRFGAFDGPCKHFPCCIPGTYNSFREMDSNITPRARLLEERVGISTPALPPETRMSLDKTTISCRERALKSMVKDMKQRNEKFRPTDRNIKYGAPLSLRKLNKPARPSYAED